MTRNILSPTVLVKATDLLKHSRRSLSESLKAFNLAWECWASFLAATNSARRLYWEASLQEALVLEGPLGYRRPEVIFSLYPSSKAMPYVLSFSVE